MLQTKLFCHCPSRTLCWVSMATFWQRGMLEGQPLWEEAGTCPVPGTASSSQLKQTHRRAQLSSWAPLPPGWPSCGNVFQKGEEMTGRRRRRREQKVWEIAEGTPKSLSWAMSLLLLFFLLSPRSVLLRVGAEQLGGRLAATQGQRTTHTLTFTVSGVRREPQEQLYMCGGNQGKVKSHPFPPCSFLRGAAECAVHSLFLSTQLRKLNSQTSTGTLRARAKKYTST